MADETDKAVNPVSIDQEKNSNGHEGNLRLADFIKDNMDKIVGEWETFARTLKPASNDMTPLALRDHIREILAFIVSDIKSPQTGPEQIDKSHGKKERDSDTTAAESHAAIRLAGGFDIDQMVSEYRSLRASVIKLWTVPNSVMKDRDIIDLTRFNESIDQELAESVSHYTKKVSYSKDLFVGILSHELRNPLNIISMASQLMLSMGNMDEKQVMLSTQILDNASLINKIINELLDLTRARFGAGIVLVRSFMDMGLVGQKLVDEMVAIHTLRKIDLTLSGDLSGQWDKARIGQVFSNLIGNAIQYGFKDSVIGVSVVGSTEAVTLSIHNNGVPIPPEKIETLFSSLTRAVVDHGDHPEAINLGLGLYITKEIVVAHSGTINVTSCEKEGTTFTAEFPRAA